VRKKKKDADASAAETNVPETVVLMDGNVAETCATDPIKIDSESFETLERAIRADVAFLESQNVMDYSLLVGIDESPGRREVVVRVIDYLRQYTWDKQIESAVKSGVPSYEGAPTVLSPAKYARRFRRAARRYFLAVPEEDKTKNDERR
jgi:1-phosphatidylinositol-3-phosphate 5-kinase